MSDKSAIEWCDASWPVTTGCDDESPGCLNCYAKRDSHRLAGNPNEKVSAAYAGTTERRDGGPIRWTGRLNLMHDRLDWPLKWKKPRRIFVGNMSDLFHPAVPDEFIDQVFAAMMLCPQHTFQVLTKRADRMAAYLNGDGLCVRILGAGTTLPGMTIAKYESTGNVSNPWPLPNVWLGVSVESQKYADERIPHLLNTPATVRFLSVEPLLGPVEFSDVTRRSDSVLQLGKKAMSGIDWVIVGGESGHGARPCDLAWIRSIVGQCKAAGVPAFVKQMGARPYDSDAAKDLPGSGKVWTEADRRERPTAMALDLAMTLDAMAVPIGDRKGGDIEDFPAGLRVREFPEPAKAAP